MLVIDMRPQNTAIRRTSSSEVTFTARTCRPVRTSQPHQRPVPAPMTISCTQTRLRKYFVNSGLDASMPAVQAKRDVYHQCSAAHTTIDSKPQTHVFQPPIQSIGP